MTLLADTHCHLNLPVFQNDIQAVLERAREKGVERILVPGVDIETSRLAVALAETYPNLFAAVGIHPGDARTWNEDTPKMLGELAQHPKTVAIGEIGLDYYRDRSPRPVQRAVFRAQLELAAELSLPVVIHNRESFADLWKELSAWITEIKRSRSNLAERPGVLHSYDGTLADAQIASQRGFFIGVSGPVTYRNATERKATVAGLPMSSVLIETDAPYLSPHPHRGRRNEPSYVALVAETLSKLHAISIETTAQATWENAQNLFHWGLPL